MKIKATKNALELDEHCSRTPRSNKTTRSEVTIRSAVTVLCGDQRISVDLTYDLGRVPTELLGIVIQAIDTWGPQLIEVE